MSLPCTLKNYNDSHRLPETYKIVDDHLKKVLHTAEALRCSYDAVVSLIATGLGFISDCQTVFK